MGLHLYEIPDKIRGLLADPEVMDPETGELLVLPQEEWAPTDGPDHLVLDRRIKELAVEKERIVLYLAKRADEEAAESEAVKNVSVRGADRAKVLENSANSLKKYIAACCKKGDKFADEYVKVRIGGSMFAESADDTTAPEGYMVQKPAPDPTPDKKAILAALKADTDVKGWSIGRGRHTVIS